MTRFGPGTETFPLPRVTRLRMVREPMGRLNSGLTTLAK
jgi:hypothetical protein